MKIKTLSYLLILLIAIIWSNTSFSQVSKTATFYENISIEKSLELGEFVFKVPGISMDQVNKSASYYPLYFTTAYSEKTELLTIKMVQSDAEGRRIILRFFSALDIQHIEINGKTYLCGDFYTNFLQ